MEPARQLGLGLVAHCPAPGQEIVIGLCIDEQYVEVKEQQQHFHVLLEAVTVVDAVADAECWSGRGRRRRRWCWPGRAARCTTARPARRWRSWVPTGRRMIRGWCGPGRWCGWPARRTGRLAELVAALPAAGRQDMAAVVLGEAAALAADPSAGLVERVVARQAAHHVRADLADRSGLTGVQGALIRGLEKLGDPAAAYDVATAALAELEALPPAARDAGQRQELLMAVLRLARTRPGRDQDEIRWSPRRWSWPCPAGRRCGLEARVWAAVDLLHRPGRRQAGLRAGPPGHRRTGSPRASTASWRTSGGCCWPSTPARPATPPWPSGCSPR